jgi:hypothetical protein
MTSKDKLNNICNYIKSKQNITPLIGSPTINISFIEMLSNDDEYMLAQKRRENRDLVIDITLGEKNESEWSKRDSWGDDLVNITTDTSVVMPKVLTMSIGKSIYKNHDEVYDYIIDFIDKNTNKPKSLLNGGQSQQFNIKLGQGNYSPDLTDMEKHSVDIRRIITKVNLCSSVVSIEGRIGPAKTVLVGKNNWNIFNEIDESLGNMGFKFIYDDKIDPEKVIVLRNNDTQHPGIYLIENNGDFYIKETPHWHRQFCWFWIT